MFRPASRVLLRTATSRPIARNAASRRFLSSTPAQKPRSWKNTALRWGVAAAAVYYYNTHDVFAEEPAYAPAAAEVDDTESLPTIEQIAAQRRQRMIESSEPTSNSVQTAPAADAASEIAPGSEGQPNSVEGLQAEADQQGAFNPETGEINWDCPCLGGMAHGPCGEEFKAAFSCFVYSTEEPKGMDCIDKFKGMQDCFRRYPDIYGAELEDDEDDVTADEASASAASLDSSSATAATSDAPSPINNAVAENDKIETTRTPIPAPASDAVNKKGDA